MKKMVTCLLTTIMLMVALSVQSVSAYEPWIEENFDPADHKINRGNESAGAGDEVRYSNRYAAYLDVVEKCTEQFGNTDCASGPSYGTQMFTGLSFLKLVDFNEDGDEELMLVFNSLPKDDTDGYSIKDYVYNIWGYDGKQPVLLQDGTGLFGGNGGMQTISFVRNPFGIFLRRGATDSFRYDFYYGYEAEKFGLCKTLVWELKYNDETRRSEQVYYEDDEPVTQDFYNSEKELWDGGSSSYAEEYYSLTPHNTEEKDKVWDLIDETIRFLQQHCQELSITQEKGKTLLNVQFHQAQEDPPVYMLVQRDMDTGEEKTIALLQPPSTTDDEEDQEYTITYDFSTQLNLESGSYQFKLIDQKASEDDEPAVVLSYIYDESEKIAEDDEFGNEREYRRVLSQAKENNPMDNNDVCNNIRTRYINLGFTDETVEMVISILKNAPSDYQKLFLYAFYKYYIKYDYPQNANSQFIRSEKTIHFSKSIENQGMLNSHETYYKLFHETGHAVDRISGMTDWDHFENGAFYDALAKDVRNKLLPLFLEWADKNNVDFEGKDVIYGQGGMFDHVCDCIIGPNYVKIVEKHFFHEKDRQLELVIPESLNAMEREAFSYMVYGMRDELAEQWDLIAHLSETASNGNMIDVFTGITNNKFLVGTGMSYNLLHLMEPFFHGPNGDVDAADIEDEESEWYYWYNKDGSATGLIELESYAEFFAGNICGNTQLQKINREYCHELCKEFDKNLEELQKYYIEGF